MATRLSLFIKLTLLWWWEVHLSMKILPWNQIKWNRVLVTYTAIYRSIWKSSVSTPESRLCKQSRRWTNKWWHGKRENQSLTPFISLKKRGFSSFKVRPISIQLETVDNFKKAVFILLFFVFIYIIVYWMVTFLAIYLQFLFSLCLFADIDSVSALFMLYFSFPPLNIWPTLGQKLLLMNPRMLWELQIV